MPDQVRNGALRDDDNALVVVQESAAVAPLTWMRGWLVDADRAVVITEPS